MKRLRGFWLGFAHAFDLHGMLKSPEYRTVVRSFDEPDPDRKALARDWDAIGIDLCNALNGARAAHTLQTCGSTNGCDQNPRQDAKTDQSTAKTRVNITKSSPS